MGFLLLALALQDQGVQIISESAPVRTGPDAAYARIGDVLGGQLYVSTARQNGFHKIWYNRSEGWIHESAAALASVTYDAVTSGTNVRSGPTTSAPEVGYAVKTSKWVVIGTYGSTWHRIFYEGREAWFSAGGRSTSHAYAAPGGETPVVADEVVEIAVASIPVRTGPGLTFETLGSAGQGQAYVSSETRSNWRKIRWSREEGWIPAYAAALRSASIDLVTNPWANVRTGPGTSHALLGSVPAGTKWAAVAFAGSWHNIAFAGQSAWISGTLTSTSDFGAPPGPSTAGFIKLPASGPGFIRRCAANNPDHAWGTSALVNGLVSAAEAWAAQRPENPAIRLGDLSLPQGGPFIDNGVRYHVTHQHGTDVDIFPLRADASSDGALDVYDPAYSSERTRDWVVNFLAPAFPEVNTTGQVLNCDPALFGMLTTFDSTSACPGAGCPLDASGAHVQPSAAGLPYVRCNPGHDDHLHVQTR